MLAEQIHAYLRKGAGYERVQVGPFLATFTPGTDHPMRNYAIPEDGATPSTADIADLVACYRDRGLLPRLEYLSGAAPGVEPALLDAGFVAEASLPVLAMTDGDRPVRPTAAGVGVAMAVTDEDHADAMVVAGLAYGEPGPPPHPLMIKARRAMVDRGGGVALARLNTDARPVGSGLYPIPELAVTEIAAVGVLEEQRGLGVAGAIIGLLAESALRAGVRLVWLTAENEPEQHAAEKAGLHPTGTEMLHISLPPTSS